MIAKIYDPVNYKASKNFGMKEDCIEAANRNYSGEAVD
jgi:hypothetical protein